MNFNSTIWAEQFGHYDGKRGGISYKVTLSDGTVIKANNWVKEYDREGYVIPYVKIEREVKQVKDKRGR